MKRSSRMRMTLNLNKKAYRVMDGDKVLFFGMASWRELDDRFDLSSRAGDKYRVTELSGEMAAIARSNMRNPGTPVHVDIQQYIIGGIKHFRARVWGEDWSFETQPGETLDQFRGRIMNTLDIGIITHFVNDWEPSIRHNPKKEGAMKRKEPKEIRTREQARDAAQEWQQWQSTQSLSWGEMAEYAAYFTMLGKKFGLLREFRKNGII